MRILSKGPFKLVSCVSGEAGAALISCFAVDISARPRPALVLLCLMNGVTKSYSSIGMHRARYRAVVTGNGDRLHDDRTAIDKKGGQRFRANERDYLGKTCCMRARILPNVMVTGGRNSKR